MRTVWWLAGFGLGFVTLSGCKVTPVESPSGGSTGIDPVLSQEVHAVMDEAVDPCADFYRFACGQWLDEHPLPADQPRFGRFHELREGNKAAMREILDELSAAPRAEGEGGQLGRFYATCLDQAAADEAGLEALAPLLQQIRGADDLPALMKAVASLHQLGAHPLFSVGVDPDYDDPTTHAVHLSQGGLGMPDRDYYLEPGAEADALRKAYEAHVSTMLAGAGQPDAASLASAVVAFETALAKASLPREQLRDPDARRNMIDVAKLSALAPALPWATYLEAVGRPDLARLNVAPPAFFERMSKIVAGAEWPVLRGYLQWHLLHALGPDLPGDLGQAHFAFFDQRLRGQAEPTPRWRHCVETTDEALGEALGREFVERRFSASSKELSGRMIAQIEAAFEAALPELAWMDDTTRGRALEKMHAIVNKVGYPDAWRDYSGLAVGGEHLANVVAERRFHWRYEAAKIGRAVDQGEWHMTPPTVNAYYNPSGNEMVFPAGILQPPFFSAEYPMAMNFGGIGMVMGHELTHGFDDQGRKFDGSGRLTEWWGADAVSRFEERAACVDALYSSYEIQPGVNLNGALTLGENIADLGGIRQTHRAYRAWAAEHDGDASPHVEGLTNEQLLFVSFGQIWCTHASPQTERVLARTDPHSHARYRVNGPLSNFPRFWEAFACEEGTPMHPASVCEVW